MLSQITAPRFRPLTILKQTFQPPRAFSTRADTCPPVMIPGTRYLVFNCRQREKEVWGDDLSKQIATINSRTVKKIEQQSVCNEAQTNTPLNLRLTNYAMPGWIMVRQGWCRLQQKC